MRASGEISAMQEKSENLKDDMKSGAREIGLLGVDIGKGVAREFGSLGADFLITFGTLGAVEPPYTRRGRSRRRRR
jgi:hypothetical protein